MPLMDNTLFGLVGGGQPPADDPDMQAMLRRLQMLAAGTVTQGAQSGLPGSMLQAVRQQSGPNKTDPLPQAAQPPGTAASAESRFLETQKRPVRYQEFAPFETTVEPTRPQDRVGAFDTRVEAAPAPQAPHVSSGRPVRLAQANAGTMNDGSNFLQRFGEGMAAFGDALTGKVPASTLAGQGRSRNATYDALIKMGVEPEIARGAVLNPDLLKAILVTRLGKGQGTSNKNIIWGTDERPGSPTFGQRIPLQANDAGQINASQLPPGIKVDMKPHKIAETETHVLLQNTDGSTQWVDKNVAEGAAAREEGKKKGEAVADLPRVMENGAYILETMDDLLEDPDRGRAVGPIQGVLPNISGTARRVQSKINQVLGQTFLQAFAALRGGGQITEAEGAKATAALNRMQEQGMTDEDYYKAARTFRREVIGLINMGRARAGKAALPEGSFATVAAPDGRQAKQLRDTYLNEGAAKASPTTAPPQLVTRGLPKGAPAGTVLPNPNFDPSKPESLSNPRYVESDGKD